MILEKKLVQSNFELIKRQFDCDIKLIIITVYAFFEVGF